MEESQVKVTKVSFDIRMGENGYGTGEWMEGYKMTVIPKRILIERLPENVEERKNDISFEEQK
jgi:hypothetical protein